MSSNSRLAQMQYRLEVSKAENTRRIETAKILLDEWKWRHQHCWKSLNRGLLTAITVSLSPYVWLLKDGNNAFKSGLGFWVFVFPFVALIIAQVAISLFAGEYVRCRPVLAKYNIILGKDSPNPPDKSSTVWRKSVAQHTIFFSGLLATILSIINANLLSILSEPKLITVENINLFRFISLLIFFIFIGYDLWLMQWTRKDLQERLIP